MNKLELAVHWLRGRDTLPRYLILGMTNLCNSKCVTCFYWDHLNVNRHLEMSARGLRPRAGRSAVPLLASC